MGDLRLYAIGAEEVRAMLGADEPYAAQLTEIAERALAPQPAEAPMKRSLLSRLGPIHRRPPDATAADPNRPTREDLTQLLQGRFTAPERMIATWRLLEILVQGWSWGTIRLSLDQRALDDLDFALARGGVAAAVGVGHLTRHDLHLPLRAAPGLSVGFHPYDRAVAMADAYRTALPQLPGEERQELVSKLVSWLDGFPHWADVAPQVGRPAPDLVGFWVS